MPTSPSRRIPKPILLCILDGWGHDPDFVDNAITAAPTPVWDRLCADGPFSLLETSGQAVGLPDGQMGNSEVGHMTIGAGRIVEQGLPRINAAIANASLAGKPALTEFIATLRRTGGTAHLMGLVSPGGVHSLQDHIASLANTIATAGVPVAIHAFLDGRDTPPRSGRGFMVDFVGSLNHPAIRIASVSGRYYAMDRDNRWDRVVLAYNAIVSGAADADSAIAPDPLTAIDQSYAADIGDEFVVPTVIDDYSGVADGDGIVMANFRGDRAREILSALLDPAFDNFPRPRPPSFAAAVGMVEYSDAHNAWLSAIFPPVTIVNGIGQVIADAGLTQLRIAETEKYAHVTFFLNGGQEQVFPGEQRDLIPSPKVATYDLQPEMSAPEITDRLVAHITAGTFDVIIVNYANGDMVGHTGNFAAAQAAAVTIDACLDRLQRAIADASGVMLITADHGNCEHMTDADGGPHTAHTTGPVPLVIVNAPAWVSGVKSGRLCDVAPTMLELLGISQPAEMTGHSLIQRATQSATEAA